MPDPILRLNSIPYTLAEIAPGVHVIDERIEPFATVVRQDGFQRLQSVLPHSKLVLSSPVRGFGLTKILAADIDNPIKLERSKESDLDTRFIPTTLGRLEADSTEPTLSLSTLKIPRVGIEFGGNLLWFWDADLDSSGRGDVHVASYGGASTTWGTSVLVATGGASGSAVGLSVTVDEAQCIFLYLSADDHLTFRSTDASTWSAASTQPTANQLANNVTSGENIHGGEIVTVPGVGSYILAWDENNLVIDIFKSTDQAANWTATATSIASAPNGVHGAVVYFDLNGDQAPVFVTDGAIWAWDTSADSIHKLVDLPASSNNGRAIAVWANPFLEGRDSLYIGLGDGRFLEYTFISTVTSPRVRIYDMNFNGALDADREGHAVRMVPSNKWLYFTYGGQASGDLAWIGAFDGRGTLNLDDPSEGFHHIFQHDTGNLELDVLSLSPLDDSTPRLHYNIRLTATTENTEFILRPDDPPTGPATINYQSSGVMDRPRIDGGLPGNPASWLSVFSETDDLSSNNTNEHINLDRGVNGATPSTDIGDILSGTRTLAIAAGAGVEGREFQLRENYARGSTTSNTPKGFSSEITYRKKINKITAGNDNSDSLRRYTVRIDVKQSVSPEYKTWEEVVKTLFDAEGNIPLQTMQLAAIGTSGTLRNVDVKVKRLEHRIEASSSETQNAPSQVDFVVLEMEEII